MNLRLIKKVGKCANCGEKGELEIVVIDGKEKEFCDICSEGVRIEQNETNKSKNTLSGKSRD